MKCILILSVLVCILIYILQCNNNKKEKGGGTDNIKNTNEIVEYNKTNANEIYEELKNKL